MLNTIEVADLHTQIGDEGSEDFDKLCKWFQLENPRRHFRYAPSIVVRSEAEILGSSIPRFAVRGYMDSFDNAANGFINFRRLPILRRHAPPTWTEDLKKVRDSIADCVLQKPDRRYAGSKRKPADLSGYLVLSEHLGNVYGEGYEKAHDFAGTPFLTHIQLAGGGLCAQAVCFMATLLLKESANRVYGLAEITHMALRSSGELKIAGLNPLEIERYFNRAGLRANIQQGRNVLKRDKPGPIDFGCSLRAYLRSGMPVIVPVDVGRLSGRRPESEKSELTPDTSIYGTNGLLETIDGQTKNPRQPHAILLVGCHEQELSFLINDPAAFPFIDATAGQLALAAAYGKGGWTPQQELFMAVTPARVRSLLHERPPIHPSTRSANDGPPSRIKPAPGLLPTIAPLQGRERPKGYPPFAEVDPQTAFHDLLLLPMGRLATAEIQAGRAPEQAAEIQGKLRQFVEKARQVFGWKNNHWIWLQNTPESIWIFDAEQAFPSDLLNGNDDAQCGFLRAICYARGNRWQLWHPPSAQSP